MVVVSPQWTSSVVNLLSALAFPTFCLQIWYTVQNYVKSNFFN